MATSGGLLAVTNPDNEGRRYTNLNGLGTTDITDVIEAADGQKWVTGFGRLIKFNGLASERFIFADNDGDLFALYCVEDDGDHLWVGTERGLVLFSKTIDGGLILDNYRLFGDMSGEPAVIDIETAGDTIFLATPAGLAVADKSNPSRLKAPDNWTTYTSSSHGELATDDIRRVAWFNASLHLATASGLYRLNVAADTLIRFDVGSSSEFTDMIVQNDSLWVFSASGHGFVDQGVIFFETSVGMPSFGSQPSCAQ
jgi:hypothetical protein